MSKLKRWTLGEVIRKAVQVTTDFEFHRNPDRAGEAGFKEKGGVS